MTSAILLALMLSLPGGEPTASQANPDQERERQQSVAMMAPAKAKQLNVVVGGGQPTSGTLHPEPLLRWSNATAGSIYGEVFLWSVDNRPVAVASIYRWYHPFKDSTVEIVSLSESTVELREAGESMWKSPAQGVSFKTVPDAPAPATSRGMRLSQMRSMARRFAAELADDRGGEQVNRKLRLLNQPIHRYNSETDSTVDGALFAFVESTDPEALLILETVNENGKLQWRFAVARMNAHALKVLRDGVIVESWVRVTDPANDPRSLYAYFNFDPDRVKGDR